MAEQKLPEIITEDELLKIIGITKHKHHKLAFMLGFYECMRISEVINLKPENIDYDSKLIKIKKSKRKKDRNIPIAPEVRKYLKHLPINITSRALRYAFKTKIKKALGRTDLSFHSLRHSGITHYLTSKKWSSLMVQRLAGHSRVSTTQIYSHVNPQDLVDRMWEK